MYINEHTQGRDARAAIPVRAVGGTSRRPCQKLVAEIVVRHLAAAAVAIQEQGAVEYETQLSIKCGD